MASAQLAQADREVAIGTNLFVEDLNMPWTAHGLEREHAFTVLDHEHVVAEFLKVATPFPKGAGEELRRANLAKPGPTHLPVDVVLEHAVQDGSPWMPEHHARRIVLLMEKIEAIANRPVVAAIHAILQSLVTNGGGPKTTKAPTVAGGA